MTIDRGIEKGKDRKHYTEQAKINGIPRHIFNSRLSPRNGKPSMTMEKASSLLYINKVLPVGKDEKQKILEYLKDHSIEQASFTFNRGRTTIQDLTKSNPIGKNGSRWGFV